MRYGMTAFARIHRQIGAYRVQVEIRSVNHRYLEITPRIGEQWRHLEAVIRECFQQRLKRGKVDCWLTVEASDATAQATLDESALAYWLDRLEGHRYESLGQPKWAELLSLPGVINREPQKADINDATVLSVFKEALEDLIHMRAAEGEAMSAVIAERLDGVAAEALIIRSRYAEVSAAMARGLREKIAALAVEVDNQRLEQELVYLLSRADIAEELDRIDFHVQETRRALAEKGPVGRRLDFIMQEFNREANTLAAKSGDSEISHCAVNLKVLIEQMREQVQNLE